MKYALLFIIGGGYCMFAEKFPAIILLPIFAGMLGCFFTLMWILEKCWIDY